MDIQQILQTIHRNQQQIDLLTTNNSQLIETLMRAGAVTAARALLGVNGHENAKQAEWREITTELAAVRAETAAALIYPGLPPAKKRRGPGRPKVVETAKPGQRFDTLGRRIPENVWTPELRAAMSARQRGSGEWTPARRKQAAERMRQVNEERAAAKTKITTHGWSPESRAKLSASMQKARERKAKLGLDYKTGRPLASAR